MTETKPHNAGDGNINSGTSILNLLKGKDINNLDLKERKTIAQLLHKQNFADKLTIPNIPSALDSPLYQFTDEIKTANIVYETNKRVDELWMAAMVSENPEEFQPALTHLGLIHAQINQYQEDIAFAGAYLEQPKNVAILQSVREKYLEADAQLSPEASMIERVANRTLRFSNLQASSDLDMTMTKNTDYLSLLAHARQFENFLHHNGRETLPFVMARYAKETLVHFESLYKRIGKTLPLRPGVQEFFKLTHDLGIPVSILSANFRIIVSGCLEQIPPQNRSHLLAVDGLQTNSIVASHKEITTAQRVLANPDYANFLCLDGLSDKGCLEGPAAGTSAAIFVLNDEKNPEFAQFVENSGQPYFKFNDFNDINAIILKIIKEKTKLQPEAKI